MEIGAISWDPDLGPDFPPPEDTASPEDPDYGEGLIAAFGKNAVRKSSRYPPASTKSKPKKTSRPPLLAKKIREREERRKKVVCHWCKETGHYQRQCPEYVQCHLQFLRQKGIEVHDQDLDRNAMEIAAMAEGIFSPDPSYLTEELEQHLDRLGQIEEEEVFLAGLVEDSYQSLTEPKISGIKFPASEKTWRLGIGATYPTSLVALSPMGSSIVATA